MKKYPKSILMLFLSSALLFNGSVYHNSNTDKKARTFTLAYMKNIFFNVDVNDVQASLKIWVDETLKHYKTYSDYRFVNKIYENVNELNKAAKNDNITIVSISTYDYLSNENVDMQPFLVPEIDNEIGVEYYLLVNKNKNYKTIKDLKGKNIGLISTPIFIASSLWLDVTLYKNSLPVKTKFFGKIESSKKESQLVLNVFFGNLDACIVPKSTFRLMIELNPQIGEELHSILNSPLILSGLVCYSNSNTDTEMKDEFYRRLIGLHKLNVGKQICTLLKIGKLVPAKSEYLKSFAALLKDHKNIIN